MPTAATALSILHAMPAFDPGGTTQLGRDVRTSPAETVVEIDASHGQALFGFVRRLGLTDAQADDAVQEVLTRLFAALERGEAVERPVGWVYRSIYRLAMDEHRLRRRLAGLVGLLDRSAAPASGPSIDDRIAVWAEVDRLPTRQRQVLYLRYRADLPFEDIADALGMSSSGARSHATQGLATIRRRLQASERER